MLRGSGGRGGGRKACTIRPSRVPHVLRASVLSFPANRDGFLLSFMGMISTPTSFGGRGCLWRRRWWFGREIAGNGVIVSEVVVACPLLLCECVVPVRVSVVGGLISACCAVLRFGRPRGCDDPTLPREHSRRFVVYINQCSQLSVGRLSSCQILRDSFDACCSFRSLSRDHFAAKNI